VPLLRGSLIKRYRILWKQNYWISFGDWLAEPRYSARYDAAKKIVIRQTGDSLIATLDESRFIARDNLYTIVSRSPKASLEVLLALLNSRFLTWYYQNIVNPEKGEALAQVKRTHIAQLPVPQTDATRGAKLSALVRRILTLHRREESARHPQEKERLRREIDAVDRQIDRLVYELYGLSEEEIGVVEGSTGSPERGP